jgi:hypothetical protein
VSRQAEKLCAKADPELPELRRARDGWRPADQATRVVVRRRPARRASQKQAAQQQEREKRQEHQAEHERQEHAHHRNPREQEAEDGADQAGPP